MSISISNTATISLKAGSAAIAYIAAEPEERGAVAFVDVADMRLPMKRVWLSLRS